MDKGIKVLLGMLVYIILTGCSNSVPAEMVARDEHLKIVIDNVPVMLTKTPSEELLDLIGNYYVDRKKFEYDTNKDLQSINTLNEFMYKNKEIANGSITADNATYDEYIMEYYESTNKRILGGTNTEGGYMSLAVTNEYDEAKYIKDSKITSVWIMDDTVPVVYNGIITGDTYDDVIYKLDVDYTDVSSDYADKGILYFNKGVSCVIYFNDDKVIGVNISYI